MQFRIEWRFLKIWLKIYERILFTKRFKLNEINEEWCDDLWKIIILKSSNCKERNKILLKN